MICVCVCVLKCKDIHFLTVVSQCKYAADVKYRQRESLFRPAYLTEESLNSVWLSNVA